MKIISKKISLEPYKSRINGSLQSYDGCDNKTFPNYDIRSQYHNYGMFPYDVIYDGKVLSYPTLMERYYFCKKYKESLNYDNCGCSICLFECDTELIESNAEESTQTCSFKSQIDFDCVDYTYTYESGDENWENWLTIDNSDCENLKVIFNKNESIYERNVTLKFTQIGYNKCSDNAILISFKQHGDGSIFIKEFDYLIIRYFWSESTNGTDLDTVTVISSLIKKDGTNLEGDALSKYDFIDKKVGYNNGGTTASGKYGIYLKYGGDNKFDGNECVYLNFNNLTNEDVIKQMLSDNVSKIRVDLYGNWARPINGRDGKLNVSLLAYLGGEITVDPLDEYNFVNEGGALVLDTNANTRVCGSGLYNYQDYKKFYTHMGHVEYDISGKTATLIMYDDCAESTYELTNALMTSSITVPYSESTTNSISFNSIKNNDVYYSLTFISNVDWITNISLTNTTNPLIATYNITENTTTSERSGEIEVKQYLSNKNLKYQIIQQANETNCMNIKYVTKGIIEPVTILFKTINDTQQGGGHEVSTDGTKELCCTGLDGTNLIASCTDSTVTLSGEKEFVYASGKTVTINVTKPHISNLTIQNNENGAAKITMYDSTNNVIPITDEFGVLRNSIELANYGDKQSFGAVFTEERIIDVEYESNQWCSSDSCFVQVTFEGEDISFGEGTKNSVVIIEDFNEGFKIVGPSSSSCSGSVICYVNDYKVIVNLIFKGYPLS